MGLCCTIFSPCIHDWNFFITKVKKKELSERVAINEGRRKKQGKYNTPGSKRCFRKESVGWGKRNSWVRQLSTEGDARPPLASEWVPCCCCCWVASVVSDSVRPHRRQPTRLPCPWDSLGENTSGWVPCCPGQCCGAGVSLVSSLADLIPIYPEHLETPLQAVFSESLRQLCRWHRPPLQHMPCQGSCFLFACFVSLSLKLYFSSTPTQEMIVLLNNGDDLSSYLFTLSV